MKTEITFLLLSLALALAGCATPFRAPPDVTHIRLDRTDSPIVRVEKIWLDREADRLVVKGYIIGSLEAGDTTQAHLDITCYDDTGNALRTVIDHFSPRQIPGHLPPHIPDRRHRTAYSSYNVPLDPLPEGTARIEVRAHEGPHS